MQSSHIRRYYRRRSTATREAATFKKDNQQEHSFFGESSREPFFKPANAFMPAQSVHRKCEKCEEEDKKVHRMTDKKEEDKKLQRQPEKKEEEKLNRMEDKKEEDKKLHRATEKKEEEKLQKKKAAPSANSTAGNTSSYIHSLNGKGNSLPKKAQQFFSSKMGFDFSGVKIHTDKEANDSAKGVNAKAYTIGNNIVFNEGQYNIESGEGKRLMAHELTHVIQQNPENAVSRKTDPEKEDEGRMAIPTFSQRDVVNQNTRHFADCNGVSVQGFTDANYGNSYTAPGSSSAGSNCADCSGEDCVTNTGTVVSVFTTNPQITLPTVPSGLNECEQRAVQNFINTTLRAHEQQHVAAFNTYRGTVRTPYTYRGCAGGLDAYTQQIHDNIESARKARSDAASAALDANGANIFPVTCNCPDPQTDAVTD